MAGKIFWIAFVLAITFIPMYLIGGIKFILLFGLMGAVMIGLGLCYVGFAAAVGAIWEILKFAFWETLATLDLLFRKK